MGGKPFLTFRQQAEQIVARGMKSRAQEDTCSLIDAIERDLRFINYYRFSAYWYPFWKKDEAGNKQDIYEVGTNWETVRSLYMFDRRLRGLIFDAISRVEIGLRTQIAHIWSQQFGIDNPQQSTEGFRTSYSRTNKTTTVSKRKELLDKVNQAYWKSKDDFAVHHRNDLGIQHAKELPIWVFVEFTTFGNLANLLSHGLDPAIVQAVSNSFGIKDKSFFVSCINLLNEARNICAHQGRIWNRSWLSAKSTQLLKKTRMPEWRCKWDAQAGRWRQKPSSGSQFLLKDNDSTAVVLTVCNILLRAAASHSHWKERLLDLLTNQDAPLPDMYVHLGFTNPHWHEHPLWK